MIVKPAFPFALHLCLFLNVFANDIRVLKNSETNNHAASGNSIANGVPSIVGNFLLVHCMTPNKCCIPPQTCCRDDTSCCMGMNVVMSSFNCNEMKGF